MRNLLSYKIKIDFWRHVQKRRGIELRLGCNWLGIHGHLQFCSRELLLLCSTQLDVEFNLITSNRTSAQYKFNDHLVV
jgi:hypothetical protein